MASSVVRGKRPPNSDFTKNPYSRWSQAKLDDFLFTLADVASSGNQVIIGGYVPAKLLRQEQLQGLIDTKASPHELCVGHLFKSVVTIINRERAPWKRLPVTFLFDHSTDTEWINLVSGSFEVNRKEHRQFKALAFVHKKDHLPLQAADMVAYRLRQRIEKHAALDFSKSKWPQLDKVLFKSIDQAYSKMTEVEKDAMLRRVFVIPENMTQRQALDSINSNSISL